MLLQADCPCWKCGVLVSILLSPGEGIPRVAIDTPGVYCDDCERECLRQVVELLGVQGDEE